MQPYNGIVAKKEILEILKPYEIMTNFGVATTKFLVEKLGSIEEIQKRIIDVPIGGKSASRIASELIDRNILSSNIAGISMMEKIYRSNDFEKSSIRPTRRIKTISLNTNEMGLKGKVSYKQVMEQAERLGLTFCPAEVTPRLALLDGYRPKDYYVAIAMKPMKDSLGNPSVFGIENYDNDTVLVGYSTALLKATTPHIFIFQIPPYKQRKK
jgi:hypothetical protein